MRMHVQSQFQPQNGNSSVKNDEFVPLTLALVTGEHVQIFPGTEEDPRGIFTAADRAKGSFPAAGHAGTDGGNERRTHVTEFTEPGERPRAREEDVQAEGPPPVPSRVVWVALGRGEWMLTLPPARSATAHHLRQAATILAGRIRADAGAAGQWIQRVPGKAIDARLGPAVLYCTMTRAVLCCPGEQIAESAALAISALSAYFEHGHGGIVLTINRIPCGDLPAVLHPAAIVVHAAGAVLRAQVFVCASLVSRPLAIAIGRLGTAWLAYAGAAGVVEASRLAESCRRRKTRAPVSACDPLPRAARLARSRGRTQRPGNLA